MATFTEVRNKASRNDPEAQFNLGARYAAGVEIERSDVEAVRWYRLAAASNVRAACHELAVHLQVRCVRDASCLSAYDSA